MPPITLHVTILDVPIGELALRFLSADILIFCISTVDDKIMQTILPKVLLFIIIISMISRDSIVILTLPCLRVAVSSCRRTSDRGRRRTRRHAGGCLRSRQ